MSGCRGIRATVTSQLRTKKGMARHAQVPVPVLSDIRRAPHNRGGGSMRWSYIPRWKFTDSCGRPGVPGALHLGCAHDAHAERHHATRREFLKAGVAIATSGPGTSNLVTGLATANSEGDPVVALGGAVPAAPSNSRSDPDRSAEFVREGCFRRSLRRRRCSALPASASRPTAA